MGKIITQDEIMKLLDNLYTQVKNGIPAVSKPVEQMVKEYIVKYPDPKIASQKFINNQIKKCTTSGFLTGLGGFIALPVAIPANVGSTLYVQMRMIAGVALMAGNDLNDDEVQTFVYVCLAGISVDQILKKAGIQVGERVANNLIKKIPGEVLVKINQKIGMRFITKFGEKGVINMGKMVPLVGGILGGGFDFVETKAIASRARKLFIEQDFSVLSDSK